MWTAYLQSSVFAQFALQHFPYSFLILLRCISFGHLPSPPLECPVATRPRGHPAPRCSTTAEEKTGYSEHWNLRFSLWAKLRNPSISAAGFSLNLPSPHPPPPDPRSFLLLQRGFLISFGIRFVGQDTTTSIWLLNPERAREATGKRTGQCIGLSSLQGRGIYKYTYIYMCVYICSNISIYNICNLSSPLPLHKAHCYWRRGKMTA